MDIKILISRTWQPEEFEPIRIEVEVSKYDISEDDFKSEYDALYEKVEEAVVESEVKLKDLYTHDERQSQESDPDDWDRPIVNSRKAKERTPKRKPKRTPRRS